MSPDIKTKLPIIAALSAAVLLGTALAQGEWLWPLLVMGIVLAAIFSRLVGQRLPIVIMGFLVVGYIVGNRGFAQLSPSQSLPLFPAEVGLAALLITMIWHCARVRTAPWARDELDVFLIAWIITGTIRTAFDVRTYGIFAIRDYAMVYYALFFFVARHFSQAPSGIVWFAKTLRIASLVMLPLYLLFIGFESFFLQSFTFRGTPVLYYKTDLAGTFMSAGAIAWLLKYEENKRAKTPLVIGLALAAAMITTNNRASMLALIAPVLFLAISGRWQILKILTIAGVAGAIALACWTPLSGKSWSDSPLFGLYERTLSIVDFAGDRNYQSTGAEPKGDNNQFRTVWWKTAIHETTEANPWFGLGFGHDLAANFLRAYYPVSDEPFNVRSPHNFYVTVYARMGAVGLLLFLAVSGTLVIQAWQTLRQDTDPEKITAQIVVLALLTSATFGVVLEGPMGAVVFWIALGVASTHSISADPPPPSPASAASPEVSIAST